MASGPKKKLTALVVDGQSNYKKEKKEIYIKKNSFDIKKSLEIHKKTKQKKKNLIVHGECLKLGLSVLKFEFMSQSCQHNLLSYI